MALLFFLCKQTVNRLPQVRVEVLWLSQLGGPQLCGHLCERQAQAHELTGLREPPRIFPHSEKSCLRYTKWTQMQSAIH